LFEQLAFLLCAVQQLKFLTAACSSFLTLCAPSSNILYAEDILLLQLLGFPTAVDIFCYNDHDFVACFLQQVGFLTAA
jgi:hypothetical protein